MKATLTFNLDDPDDRVAHIRAVKALDAYLALHTISEWVYKCRKEEDRPPMTIHDLAAVVKDALDKYNINLDEELQ